MRAAVFFERDGILNLVKVERNHPVIPDCVERFQINEAALQPLKALKAAGFLLIATTNQPGISRGYLSRRDLDAMHLVLKRRFNLDDILVCAHDEMDRCTCRKPNPGLITEAGFKWQLDLDRCFMVSDKWQDAKAAHVAGCTSVLVQSPWVGTGHYDYLTHDIGAAIQKILHVAAVPTGLVQSLAV